MALDTFPTLTENGITVNPSANTKGAYSPRVLKTSFGDGYSQRMQDGINSVPQKWDVTWEGLSSYNASQVLTFLSNKGGAVAFYWTPPLESTAIKVICTSWDKSYFSYDRVTITAVFEQVFDLGT